MTELTLEPGVLRVASAFPDPPFEVTIDGKETGFDRELMRFLCDDLGFTLRPVRYAGYDFNGNFEGLSDGSYDAVISGTTITPERERVALFSDPYLEFDQGLAVNVRRDPRIKSLDDLRGRVVGIQVGNTSDLVARKLLAEDTIGDIKYYPHRPGRPVRGTNRSTHQAVPGRLLAREGPQRARRDRPNTHPRETRHRVRQY
jgi:polar amino acid transport system substrate-binding protein